MTPPWLITQPKNLSLNKIQGSSSLLGLQQTFSALYQTLLRTTVFSFKKLLVKKNKIKIVKQSTKQFYLTYINNDLYQTVFVLSCFWQALLLLCPAGIESNIRNARTKLDSGTRKSPNKRTRGCMNFRVPFVMFHSKTKVGCSK